MKNKVHYVIDGYIPSDGSKVHITTYKFQSLGNKEKKYIWIAIDSYHGIGSGTDEYGDPDRDNALLRVMDFRDSDESVIKRLYTDDFEEVIEARQKIKETLQKRLDEKQT